MKFVTILCVLVAAPEWIKSKNLPQNTNYADDKKQGPKLTWQKYDRLAEIYEYLDDIARTYPHLCTVQTIGYSIEKRPIKLLKISNGNHGNEAIWVDGGIHSREWITTATVTFIINQFTLNFTSLPEAVRSIDWYLTPVLNPDGYEFAHTKDDEWRKNRRDTGRGGKCNGVDLNRNFGYKWKNNGGYGDPCTVVYSGSEPFSEPETLAVKNFFQNSTATWKAFISFHSRGQYVIYPWTYSDTLPSDHFYLHEVGERMVSAIKSVRGRLYKAGLTISTVGYTAAGSAIDWAKGSLNIKYSYTIELGKEHKVNASEIIPTGMEGLLALTVVAEA